MTRPKGKARQRASKKARNQAVNKKFLVQKGLREDIRRWDDPILTQVCENVYGADELNIPSVIRKMKSTLRSTRTGVGLAAPQIGVAKNIIAVRSNRISNNVEILINPIIKEKSPETNIDVEGCLSYPGIYVQVERANKVVVGYWDEKQELQSKEFVGTEARIIQHECEHLTGKCIVGEKWRDQESQSVSNKGIPTEENATVEAVAEPDPCPVPIVELDQTSPNS
jgi:peptide deformylase